MRLHAHAFVGFALCVAWTAGAAAQSSEPDPHTVQPQRPTVATHAGTVSRGWIEIETGTGTTDFGVLFISSHALGPVAMDLNFGYTRRSGDGTQGPQNATLWTASFGGPARGPVGWVAEVYGYPATSGPAGDDSIVAFLVGPTIRLQRWLVARRRDRADCGTAAARVLRGRDL